MFRFLFRDFSLTALLTTVDMKYTNNFSHWCDTKQLRLHGARKAFPLLQTLRTAFSGPPFCGDTPQRPDENRYKNNKEGASAAQPQT
jgi:hypothetical protein